MIIITSIRPKANSSDDIVVGWLRNDDVCPDEGKNDEYQVVVLVLILLFG